MKITNVDKFFDGIRSGLFSVETSRQLSMEAERLYQEAFRNKRNPYGEPWASSPRDKIAASNRFFGKIERIHDKGFNITVASPNPYRSCVPIEERGLGSWREPFEAVLYAALKRLYCNV